MNLPNKLTLLRIALIPVFIVFASVRGIPYGFLFAAAVFGLASYTDYLDGHIARKRGLVTDFGKFADPLADKVLTTAAFIYMLADGVCHPLALAVMLAREFMVSGLRMVAAGAKGGKVIAAGPFGKVKTALQMATILFYYLTAGLQHALEIWGVRLPAALAEPYLPQVLTGALCWLAAAVTVASGVQYLWQSRKYVNTAK